jgi:hypothetical protein
MADGSKPLSISEVALHWFFGPGVKLDFRGLPDGHVVSAATCMTIPARPDTLRIVYRCTRRHSLHQSPCSYTRSISQLVRQHLEG